MNRGRTIFSLLLFVWCMHAQHHVSHSGSQMYFYILLAAKWRREVSMDTTERINNTEIGIWNIQNALAWVEISSAFFSNGWDRIAYTAEACETIQFRSGWEFIRLRLEILCNDLNVDNKWTISADQINKFPRIFRSCDDECTCSWTKMIIHFLSERIQFVLQNSLLSLYSLTALTLVCGWWSWNGANISIHDVCKWWFDFVIQIQSKDYLRNPHASCSRKYTCRWLFYKFCFRMLDIIIFIGCLALCHFELCVCAMCVCEFFIKLTFRSISWRKQKMWKSHYDTVTHCRLHSFVRNMRCGQTLVYMRRNFILFSSATHKFD